MVFDPAQPSGSCRALSFPGEGVSGGRAWTQGWAAGPEMSSLEMGLVFQGDHLVLENRILRQEQCQITALEPGPGQDPAWCHISGGWRPPGTLQGLSLGVWGG